MGQHCGEDGEVLHTWMKREAGLVPNGVKDL